MSNTATAGYYKQLVQTNEALLAAGATNIQLTNVTWGPITVNGNTATAISDETWISTFNDGTTEESTSTNVYTLVNQSGSWLIQDDQQASPAGVPAQATPGVGPQPAPVPTFMPVGDNTSRNWSGYAATAGRYTAITGTWTVPQLAPDAGPGIGATWVGIGGVNSRDLIQAGTQEVASGNAQSEHQAWIEMLPQASQQVPLAVAPGHSITVSIGQQGGSNNWQIAMTNKSSGQSYQTTVTYASSFSSAEWIEEAPSGRNGILPLDDFGSVSSPVPPRSTTGKPSTWSRPGRNPSRCSTRASRRSRCQPRSTAVGRASALRAPLPRQRPRPRGWHPVGAQAPPRKRGKTDAAHFTSASHRQP